MTNYRLGKLFMKTCRQNSGFTLVEMLIVIAIVIILVSMVVGITKHVEDQGKVRLCKSTIELVGNALEQFRDFDYEYKNVNYSGLSFPLDCTGFLVQGPTGLNQTLRDALYPPAPPVVLVDINQIETIHDPCYSGSEVMYFVLSQIPDCRTTLGKIDKSLLTNAGNNGPPIDIIITIGGVATKRPLTRIIDPWGSTLRYEYYDVYPVTLLPNQDTKKTFPVITSAGPDKQFDTADDISNNKP
jgi:prepilin-type N-terminal cleavage/methylation domain-containing protein